MIQGPPPLPPAPPDGSVSTILTFDAIAPAVAMLGFIIAAVFLVLPLVRAWSRRIEHGVSDAALLDEVSHLRDRVAELDGVSARMHELEERLDFAERLLTQRTHAVLPNQDRS